jgi:hypothetical protein
MNKLEESMSNMSNVQDDIDALIYAIGDAPRQYTEDELLNMLIGMSQLHKTRYDAMWQEYENFTKKSVANFDFPDYDDGTMAMKVTNIKGEIE